MARDITPIFYKNSIIYFHQSNSYKWLLDENSVIKLFKIDIFQLSKIKNRLEKDKHLILEKIDGGEITLWSRKGVIKLAYILNSETAFDIVDNFEDIEFQNQEPIFNELENILQNRLSEISKNGSFSDIENFINTLSTFVKEKNRFSKKDSGMKNMFFDIFEDALKSVKK